MRINPKYSFNPPTTKRGIIANPLYFYPVTISRICFPQNVSRCWACAWPIRHIRGTSLIWLSYVARLLAAEQCTIILVAEFSSVQLMFSLRRNLGVDIYVCIRVSTSAENIWMNAVEPLRRSWIGILVRVAPILTYKGNDLEFHCHAMDIENVNYHY